MKAMTDRYQEIRDALAMGPTPGPWAVNPALAQVDAMPSTLPVCKLLWPTTERTEAETWANGQLIAACDPDTIRALLAERDALREALTEVLRVNETDAGSDVKAWANAMLNAHAALAREQGEKHDNQD